VQHSKRAKTLTLKLKYICVFMTFKVIGLFNFRALLWLNIIYFIAHEVKSITDGVESIALHVRIL
jgi:hypothetical protein